MEKVSFELEYYAHSNTGSLVFSQPINVSYVNSVWLGNFFEFQIEQNGKIMPIDESQVQKSEIYENQSTVPFFIDFTAL